MWTSINAEEQILTATQNTVLWPLAEVARRDAKIGELSMSQTIYILRLFRFMQPPCRFTSTNCRRHVEKGECVITLRKPTITDLKEDPRKYGPITSESRNRPWWSNPRIKRKIINSSIDRVAVLQKPYRYIHTHTAHTASPELLCHFLTGNKVGGNYSNTGSKLMPDQSKSITNRTSETTGSSFGYGAHNGPNIMTDINLNRSLLLIIYLTKLNQLH